MIIHNFKLQSINLENTDMGYEIWKQETAKC